MNKFYNIFNNDKCTHFIRVFQNINALKMAEKECFGFGLTGVQDAGLERVEYFNLTAGVAALHTGIKL